MPQVIEYTQIFISFPKDSKKITDKRINPNLAQKEPKVGANEESLSALQFLIICTRFQLKGTIG